MTDQKRPASVEIHLTATDENGKPIAGIHRVISIEEISRGAFPVLIETATEAATELEGIVNSHYGIQPATDCDHGRSA